MNQNTTQHTPGPWERRGELVYGVDKGPGTAPFIAECENVEDARLIAAAPELLEALKGLIPDENESEYQNSARREGRLRSARAAIAKAEGKA